MAFRSGGWQDPDRGAEAGRLGYGCPTATPLEAAEDRIQDTQGRKDARAKQARSPLC